MYRVRTARVSLATAVAALLAITLAVTVGFSGQAAAITTSQNWADSYTVDGKCYCSSNFDHGVGGFEYQGESVRRICDRLGDGPLIGRVYYNTIQCGHEPAHRDAITIDGQRVQDEVVCPGRVGNGVPCNTEKGAKWDLSFLNDPPSPPPTTPAPTTIAPATTQAPTATTVPAPASTATTVAPATTQAPTATTIPAPPPSITVAPTPQPSAPATGPCQATGEALEQAQSNYRQSCPTQRIKDCDPLQAGGYICSSEDVPDVSPPVVVVTGPTTTVAPKPAPTTTTVATTPVPSTTPAPLPPERDCRATGRSLRRARYNYRRSCPTQRIKDCDPLLARGYICSSGDIPDRPAPITVIVPPTTIPVPEGMPEPDGMVLNIYDANTDTRIGSLWGKDFSISANELPGSLAFELAVLPAGARSVVFSASGPISSHQIENFAPYTSFGNRGPNYLGREFPVGDYQISVEIFSGWGGSGERLVEETLTFRISG